MRSSVTSTMAELGFQASVILVHLVVGMSAGAATMGVGAELFLQSFPEVSNLVLGVVLSPFLALLAFFFWPLPLAALSGGVAATILHGVFGRYRWWMAALAGLAIGVTLVSVIPESSDPDQDTMERLMVAACVVAMLACQWLTNVILEMGARRRSGTDPTRPGGGWET